MTNTRVTEVQETSNNPVGTMVTSLPQMVCLKDLNLLDRFLFDEVMDIPEMHQLVLQIIFQDDITLLSGSEVEKQLQTAPYLKSVRLDVFAVDDESVVYNTEMQKNRKSDLRKRSRFYQSLIDSGLLLVGTLNYNLLNDSYIIMIAPFDLFGLGLYQYTFRAVCKEAPELELGDGATRIFLNTKGTNPEDVSEELVEFLKYVEHSDDATAAEVKSDLVKKLHERVAEIKASEEIGVKYMQAWEEKEYDRQEARDEGLKEGLKEGHKEGLEEGLKEGHKEGLAEGQLKETTELIYKKWKKNLPVDVIAEHVETSVDYVEKICKLFEENSEKDINWILEKVLADCN